MRRSTPLLATLLGLVVSLLVAPAVRADDSVQPLATGAQLTATAYAGPTSVDIALPPQATPVRLQGLLESSAGARAGATVGVGAREVATSSVATAPIDAELTVADLADGEVRVWLQLGADDTAQCDDARITAVLSDITIWYVDGSGESGSVASYLQGIPATFTVVVDPAADRLTQQAALNAVTSLADLYPPQTQVVLRPTEPPVVDSLNRVLRFEPTQGPGEVALDERGLVISGDSASFDDVVFALSGTYGELLTAALATDVAGSSAAGVSDTLTLSTFGPEVISLTALGTVESSVGISQAQFPQPARELTVDLNGVITPVAGGTGRVNILWNGQLVNSVAMTEDASFAASTVIDESILGRDSTLTVQLQYLPASGTCAVGELPARLDIDAQRSTITTVSGETLTGFDMLPQGLEDTAVVALGQGQEPAVSMAQLAQLLVGLQRLSDAPLRISMMEWSAFVDSETSGVATGLTPQEADQLDTPLSLAPFRTVDVDQQQFRAEVAGDFAALQAYRNGERVLLALGGAGAASAEAADQIVAMMAEDGVGFPAYTGDVVAAQPGVEPFAFDVAVLASQPEQVDSRGLGELWWLWWVLGLLAAAVVIGVLVRRRR